MVRDKYVGFRSWHRLNIRALELQNLCFGALVDGLRGNSVVIYTQDDY